MEIFHHEVPGKIYEPEGDMANYLDKCLATPRSDTLMLCWGEGKLTSQNLIRLCSGHHVVQGCLA